VISPRVISVALLDNPQGRHLGLDRRATPDAACAAGRGDQISFNVTFVSSIATPEIHFVGCYANQAPVSSRTVESC
jgi:hypothetical protein